MIDDPCDDWTKNLTALRRREVEAMPHHTCKNCGESTPDAYMDTINEDWCNTCAEEQRANDADA